MIAELIERLDLPTDKAHGHAYGPFYDEALAPYRGRPIRLLEIGVERGASLRLWDAYFGEMVELVGVDIRLRDDARIACPFADLYEINAYAEWTARMLGMFDIIVDDGPHTLLSQISAIQLYASRLRPGGMLVVEDVQQREWIDALMSLVPDGYTHEAIDLAAETGVHDDRLFVVRRPL